MSSNCDAENLAYGVIPAYFDAEGRVHRGEGWSDDLAARWEDNLRIFTEYAKTSYKLKYGKTGQVSNYELIEDAFKFPEKNDFSELLRAISPAPSLPPSQAFGSKFMDPFTKKMRAFNKKHGGKSEEAYRDAWMDEISPLADRVQREILRAGSDMSKGELKAFMKERYGLKLNQVSDAARTLEWWKNGGPTSKGNRVDRETAGFFGIVRSLTAANSRYNAMYALYNVADIGRIASGATFKSPTGGIVPVLKAALKTAATLRPNGFKLEPDMDLVKAGDLSRDYTGSPLDLFHQSTIAQKNFAYHLDKELGGDGYGMLASHVFDYENFDVPLRYQETGAVSVIYSLGRFMLAETNYVINTTKRALGFGEGTVAQRLAAMPQAAAELVMYNGIKAALFGLEATIPTEVLVVLEESMGKEKYKELQEIIKSIPNTNALGNLTQAGLDMTFGEDVVKEQLGKSASVGLIGIPLLGISLKMYSSLAEKLTKESIKELVGAFDPTKPLEEKALKTAGIASGVLNLTGYAPYLNSALFTKLLMATSESVGADVNEEKAAVGMAKAVLGSRNVKKGKGKVGDKATESTTYTFEGS